MRLTSIKKVSGFEAVKSWILFNYERVISSDLTIKRKENLIKKIGDSALDVLWIKTAERRPVELDDKYSEANEEFITAATHNRYVTRMRRDLLEMGFVSITLESDIEALKNEYPKQSKFFDGFSTISQKAADDSKMIVIDKINKSIKRTKNKDTIKLLNSLSKKVSSLKTVNSLFVSIIRKGNEKLNMIKRAQDRKVKYQKKARTFQGLSMIETCYKLLKSKKWEELSIGIAMASGRRCAEVVHFGHFESAEKYTLKFSGQRKTKAHKDKVFKIPCLVESDLIIQAIERFRKEARLTSLIKRLDSMNLHEGEYSRRINGSLASGLNSKIREVLNPENLKSEWWVFKDTRAIYARLSYAIYCANCKKANRVPVQEDKFFSDSLLHTDPNEQQAYKQFLISDMSAFSAYAIAKAKDSGGKITFAERRPLLIDWLEVEERKPFKKYLTYCIAKLKEDDSIKFTVSLIRKEVKGDNKIISEFVSLLKDKKLDEKDLIVISKPEKKKQKKPRKVIKEVEVTLTFTIEVEYEVTYDEDGEPESDEWALTQESINDEMFNLDIGDHESMEWSEL